MISSARSLSYRNGEGGFSPSRSMPNMQKNFSLFTSGGAEVAGMEIKAAAGARAGRAVVSGAQLNRFCVMPIDGLRVHSRERDHRSTAHRPHFLLRHQPDA